MIEEVWVTNTGDETLIDGWNGVKFEFLPASTVKIPIEMAINVFGFRQDDKAPYLSRFGWIRYANEIQGGLDRLNKFVISTIEPPPYHVASPVVAFSSSHASRRGRGKGA